MSLSFIRLSALFIVSNVSDILAFLVFADTVTKSSNEFPISFNASSIELSFTYSICSVPDLYACINVFPRLKCCFIRFMLVVSSKLLVLDRSFILWFSVFIVCCNPCTFDIWSA